MAETARADRKWWLLLGLATCATLLINPIGFIGGGRDDWQYLDAARCWAAHGACLPTNHWQGRWPIFAPIAAITSMLGESRLTVSIWPLVSSIACLTLLTLTGNRLFGRPIGWIAALLLLAIPAFSIQLLGPSAEAIELALLLTGFLALLRWDETRRYRWAIIAGLAFGMGLQVRETSIVAALLGGIYALSRKPRWTDVAFAFGAFALPLLIEFAWYLQLTGDPLWRRRLAMNHVRISSSELLGSIDGSRSPFFNKSYIANWRIEPGLHIHWLLDGLLNLFVNAMAGLSLLLAPLLYLVQRKRLNDRDRRLLLSLYGFALAYALILIYALAIDPKARMMLAPLSATSIALAYLLHRLNQDGRRLLVASCGAAITIAGMLILFAFQRVDVAEKAAAVWIAERPGQIEIDLNTRRNLALVPGAKNLPNLRSNRPYLLFNTMRKPCSNWLEESGLPEGNLSIVDEVRISKASKLEPSLRGSFCLFRYNRQVDAQTIGIAIQRSRQSTRFE